MNKRNSFDDRGGGRSSKRRKSNDGRGISSNNSGDGCCVFVGNLKYETRWQALKDHMRQAGNVDSANILEAPNGRSKGCALVRYQHSREAQRAIHDLNESTLEGRTIFVQPDNGNPRDSNENSRPNGSHRASGDRNNDPPSQYGVFVGNLPYECSWQALKDFFKSCGFIDRAEVMEDPKTGRKKGFGTITFSNERAMENAIRKFHGKDFQGRTLEVRRDKNSNGGTNSSNINSRDPSSDKDGYKVFFGNLDFDCSWKDLKDLVKDRCGPVEHVDIPKRGWGVATFATHREAAAAISKLDNVSFQNRPLEVRWDRDKSKSGGGGGRDTSSTSSKQLYVGNLPYECTWQNLKDAFKRFGAVSHAEVCETSKGRTTGFGIVAFTKPSSAEQALKSMNGADFQGRKISVRWDRSPEKLEAEKNINQNKREQKPKRPAKTPANQNDAAMEVEKKEETGDLLDRALSAAR